MSNTINLMLPNNLNIDDFKKSIPFISQEIKSFRIKDNCLILELENSLKAPIVLQKTKDTINKFSNLAKDSFVLFKSNSKIKREYNYKVVDNLNIKKITKNSISLHNNAAKLYAFFDWSFKNIALGLGAQIEQYPTMLPIEKYNKTSYLKTSPQYSIFCCNAIEDFTLLEKLHSSSPDELKTLISNPSSALSPAACFHTYCCHESQTLNNETIFTFNQAVFRNEGRFNWDDFGRLKDYHVREIVFLGSEDFVRCKRGETIKKIIEFLKNIKLISTIVTANDSFVMPKMQKFKKIQIQEKSKYELLLNYEENKRIAAASFNIHGTVFTNSFGINIKNVDNPVTGCVGFGLERWVLAFAAQYGWCDKNWPSIVQDYINKE